MPIPWNPSGRKFIVLFSGIVAVVAGLELFPINGLAGMAVATLGLLVTIHGSRMPGKILF